jgi:serine phosphatase RsbU (regulator of sigma subunit)
LSVVWVLPAEHADHCVRGFDAGTDAVLVRPFAPEVLLAQVRAAVRSCGVARRVAARAAEARLLGERLNRALDRAARELDAARRIRLALSARSPTHLGNARFGVCHRPRGKPGSDFHAASAVGPGRVVFCVGEVSGLGSAGPFLGRFVTESVLDSADEEVSAGELLTRVNRQLLALGLDDPPLVALGVGLLDTSTGRLTLSRAGLPSPVLVPATGEVEVWAMPGPFLGVAETTYPTHAATLRPGDKLLLGTDGTRPDGTPGPGDDANFHEAAARHRDAPGRRFVDAVANELLAQVRHEDDFTLLCVECSGEPQP